VNRSLPDNIEHYLTDIGARRRVSCIIAGVVSNFALQLTRANFSGNCMRMNFEQVLAARLTVRCSSIAVIVCLLIGTTPLVPVRTLIASEPLAKGIQDNSFFIEEAYNQEPGVVQHIFNLPIDFTNGGREMAPSFTQEWPMFTQTHQFSYTIPYVVTEEDNGMEDMQLNYRLQAFNEDKYTPAFAPRLSLVLPTGDQTKDLGAAVVGYEFNLPFSKIVSDLWTMHFNAGMSVFPNAHQSRHLTNYNVGASAIYAVSRDFNLMLEALAGWNEDIAEGVFAFEETVERSTTAIISPGVRYAFNLPNDAQLVIGAALPIGLTSDSPDWGLFFYCSFEHEFTRTKASPIK
jgi:Putative MetA-pathway of phenol degradation